MKTKSHVAVNEAGRRIGESHPRAKLTDHEVDLIRELIENGMSLREIAKKFERSYGYIGKIGRCEYRADAVADHRVVERKPRR